MNKDIAGHLYIESILKTNTDLINIKTGKRLKKIIVNAKDSFYKYEIELNEDYKLMTIPVMLKEKYALDYIQLRIDEFLEKESDK